MKAHLKCSRGPSVSSCVFGVSVECSAGVDVVPGEYRFLHSSSLARDSSHRHCILKEEHPLEKA